MADQRTVSLVDGLVDKVRGFIRDERVTYPEYHAALQYLIRTADAGEIPLLVAAFAESTVDTVNADGGRATDSAIVGPYYKPGAPWLQRPYKLPMRPDEPGDPLLFCGRVESASGAPLASAVVDMWQSTSDGMYSFFTPKLPDQYVLRGRLRTGATGEFEIRTIRPVPYQIPREGPVGDLLENILGRHSWRAGAPALQDRRRRAPAADHAAVLRQRPVPGQQLRRQGVKGSLVIDLTKANGDGGSYRGEYVFRLAPPDLPTPAVQRPPRPPASGWRRPRRRVWLGTWLCPPSLMTASRTRPEPARPRPRSPRAQITRYGTPFTSARQIAITVHNGREDLAC